MSKPCLDFLGHEIKAGDTIVYPGRRGSRMWMVKSRVTMVSPPVVPGKDDGVLRVQHPNGSLRLVTNVQRVVVVTSLVEN